MDVLVTSEQRFERTPDGAVWTPSQGQYSFWMRYCEVFDRVRVIARVKDVTSAPDGYRRANGPGVHFEPVPWYIGPRQYLRSMPAIRRSLNATTLTAGAAIVRLPSAIGAAVAVKLRKAGRPYAVEVVGDPYDVFAPGVVEHPLRPYLRVAGARSQRRNCRRAAAASYVTKYALQRRYPCPKFMVGVSDVQLSPADFVEYSRARPSGVRFEICSIMSLDQMYKGPDVLLSAVAECRGGPADVHVTLIGDGKFRTKVELLAQQLGIRNGVEFAGHVGERSTIHDYLDRADAFALPSRTEGLPRALLEAMARGLPCIASAVGGIPELLAPEDLFPSGDSAALARLIQAVAVDEPRRTFMSQRNLSTAQEYSEERLRVARSRFYWHVRELTAGARTSANEGALTWS